MFPVDEALKEAVDLCEQLVSDIKLCGFPGSPEIWEYRNNCVRILFETQNYIKELEENDALLR